MNTRSQRELQNLLDVLLDGPGGDEEMLRLEAALGSDADARRHYIEHMTLVFDLEQEVDTSSPGEPAKRPEKLVLRAILLALAVSVLAALTVSAGLLVLKNEPPVAAVAAVVGNQAVDDSPHAAMPPLARLAEVDRARFSDEAGPVDDHLNVGAYRLAEGAISLVFRNGVELDLESPADFEILSELKVVLHRGRVRAYVPDSGKGFTVVVPEMEIEDLGTEFGVFVGEDRATELHVFSGEVKLHRDGRAPESFEEGLAAVWRDGVRHDLQQPDDSAFLTRSAIGYRRWLSFSRRLRADPSNVLYFDFERDPAAPNRLKNLGGAGPAADGVARGAFRVSGRWAEKGALLFERDDDIAEMTVPGEFDAFTLSTWVLATRLDAIQAICNTRGWEPAAHHWHLRRDGSLQCSVRDGYSLRSPEGSASAGVWMQLAAVVDRTAGTANYYVNGVNVLSCEWLSDSPMRFGPCFLGGWDASRTRPPRGFRGRIDELALFNRAFSAREIAEIHEAGSGFDSSAFVAARE